MVMFLDASKGVLFAAAENCHLPAQTQLHGHYSDALFARSSRSHLSNVEIDTLRRDAASDLVICPSRYAFRVDLYVPGLLFFGRPNLTPRAFAAAMPSACRWWMLSRSTCAT